jgi:predicted DNA-binding protein
MNTKSTAKEPKSKMVSFRLPIKYLNLLQQIADQTGQSKSAVLRQGLDALQSTPQ